MHPKFIEAVETGQVSTVRFALSNELLLDPRGESFEEMRQYAENKLSNLYEADEDFSYPSDSSKWDRDFLFTVKNDLDMGFSKNKLVFYKEVAQYVLRDKSEALNEEDRRSREVVIPRDVDGGAKTDPSDNKKLILFVVVAIILLIVMVRSCGSSDSSSDKKQDIQKGKTQTEQTK